MSRYLQLWPERFSLIPCREDDLAVVLAEERCRLDIDGGSLVADARIAFRPHRFPSAQIELADLDFDVTDEKPVSLALEVSGFAMQHGFLGGIPWQVRSNASRFRHRVRQTEPMQFVKDDQVVEVEALVYNLSQFGFGGGPTNGLEQLTLETPSGWKATVGPLALGLRNDRSILELLGSPWRRPTDALQLSRTRRDGALPREAHDVLSLFQYFLSFAWGRFIGVGLGQGFSSIGALSYILAGITHVDPLTYPVARPPHWFPPSQAEILSEILPAFWQKMTDPVWKDQVEWALYWWLSANHSAQVSEASILASQAGLESVVFGVLCDLARLPKEKVEKMATSKKIQEMLDFMRISRVIPGQLDELRSFAKGKGYDGPQALTGVRNALVHPSKGGETGLAFEASQLGMWYLELTLLFLFGYRGKILNRTIFRAWWWEQELVPWAQP
jgi:hypothetical protein